MQNQKSYSINITYIIVICCRYVVQNILANVIHPTKHIDWQFFAWPFMFLRIELLLYFTNCCRTRTVFEDSQPHCRPLGWPWLEHQGWWEVWWSLLVLAAKPSEGNTVDMSHVELEVNQANWEHKRISLVQRFIE